jgi:hypothetical protein
MKIVNRKGHGWGGSLALAMTLFMPACGKNRDFVSVDELGPPTDPGSQAPGSEDSDGAENLAVPDDARFNEMPGASVSALDPSNGRIEPGQLGECTDGDTESCGPESENGICRFGTRTCAGARLRGRCTCQCSQLRVGRG